MNTERLQLIIEDLIELAKDDKTLLLIEELIEEVTSKYRYKNWDNLGENLEKIYRSDEKIYNILNLADWKE